MSVGPAIIRLGGRDWPRIPYGSEAKLAAGEWVDCPDCGVEPGHLHSRDCDVEQCPVCGLQLLMCIALERHEEKGTGDWSDSPWAGDAFGPPATGDQ